MLRCRAKGLRSQRHHPEYAWKIENVFHSTPQHKCSRRICGWFHMSLNTDESLVVFFSFHQLVRSPGRPCHETAPLFKRQYRSTQFMQIQWMEVEVDFASLPGCLWGFPFLSIHNRMSL